MQLGEILVRRHYITTTQLEKAISVQMSQEVHRRLGRLLLSLNFLKDEYALVRARKEQYWRSQNKWIID
ncbi:MAG: hypothetical protein AAGD25_39850 [Cyanobacteria bacterium P01_F01_bin.150]